MANGKAGQFLRDLKLLVVEKQRLAGAVLRAPRAGDVAGAPHRVEVIDLGDAGAVGGTRVGDCLWVGGRERVSTDLGFHEGCMTQVHQ